MPRCCPARPDAFHIVLAGPICPGRREGEWVVPTKREQFQHSIRAQYLGERMRRLREDRGLTLKYIASYLGVEFSTLARYERAEWPFRPDHVITLLDVYGVYDENLREGMVALARNAWRVCHWQIAGVRDTGSAGINEQPIIDHWWMQSKADELCVYATTVVPPLLRTRDYAETIIRHTQPQATVMKVDYQIRQLLDRQRVLEEKPPVRLTAILEESVLSRPVGSPAVLQAQLEHLTRMVERPHISVLVLPTISGLHAGVDGGFTVCRMHNPYPPVALLDQLTGRAVLEADAADRYNTAFDGLKEIACNPVQSVELFTTAAGQLNTGYGSAEHEAVAA